MVVVACMCLCVLVSGMVVLTHAIVGVKHSFCCIEIPPPIHFKCTIDHLSPEFLWRVTLLPRYQFNSFPGLSPASDWLRCARLLQQACARSPTLCARGYVLLTFPGSVCGRDCPAMCACLYNAHKGWQPQEQAKEGLVSKKSWN